MHKALIVLMFLCPVSISATDLSSFEKILLPLDVGSDFTGAAGSHFAVYFAVYAEVPYSYFPCTADLSHPGGVQICETVPGQAHLQIGGLSGAAGGARIIFVDRPVASQIAMTYFLTSGPGVVCDPFAPCGSLTSLPVVRESAFRTGKIVLMEIPATARYRHTLRIYDVDSRGGQAFRVSVLLTPTVRTTPDAQKTFMTDAGIGRLVPDPNYALTYPPYAQISLEHEFNDLCFPRIVCGAAYTVRVAVEAVDPTTRFWTFVSATNNLSQEVTIFEPK